MAEWVLDELRGSLPDADLVMGRMEGDLDWYSQDQVAAAAELGVLCRADHVVLTSGSTFSWFAHNWREAAGISASLEQTIGNSSWRNTTEGMQGYFKWLSVGNYSTNEQPPLPRAFYTGP